LNEAISPSGEQSDFLPPLQSHPQFVENGVSQIGDVLEGIYNFFTQPSVKKININAGVNDDFFLHYSPNMS
jgi:hypothetical protein